MKTQAKVSISKIWLPLRFLFRGGFKLYKLAAMIIGTFFIVAWSLLSIEFLFENEIDWFSVPLDSGFVYVNDMKDGSKDGHNLSDMNGKIIIFSDVKRFVESGNVIYGYREDLHGNPFYFICDYGDDCTDSQNLTDVQLRKIIEERGLSLYTSNSGTSRSDLKQSLESFYKEYGSENEPKWEYDKTWSKYRITRIRKDE